MKKNKTALVGCNKIEQNTTALVEYNEKNNYTVFLDLMKKNKIDLVG